ncbi:asparagine synthase-related protein [Iodidimonas sp. SYSU 1G8]|uniref:asparagine synthase-related protein n=1 Tax=Iodidimonas sp. SYSU 1G8 TaxID=3133967 RepID=UPI0031FEB34A
MRTATFIAVVSTAVSNSVVEAIESRHAPACVTRLALPGGWLTLYAWQTASFDKNPLITLDASRGNEIPIPLAMIDAASAPVGLRNTARQHQSYLWLDEAGELVLWTDHLGISPLYHAVIDGTHLVSDGPGLLAELAPGVDDAMVASFLATGIMLRGRTLFARVRGLPPAAIARIAPGGDMAVARYWRHRPGTDPWADRTAMERELWSRVTASAAAHTAGRHSVLALSGGYDSSALLGILHAAGARVSTFSFATGTPKPGSDADVARQQAAFLGIEHKVYTLPQALDPVDLVETHLRHGAFMRKPCYEIDAYHRAATDARERWRNPLLLFGDEAFGQGALRLEEPDELLGAITLKNPRLIEKIAAALPAGDAARLVRSLRQSYDDLVAEMPAAASRYDIMDSLFLDTFLIANMVRIRAALIGPHTPFALPYLDLRVLDMARHVPSHIRVDKALFEAAAARNLPDLFRIRRARTRQSQPDISATILGGTGRLTAAIGALGGSGGRFTPDTLLAALELVRTDGERPSALRTGTFALGKMIVRRKLLPAALTNAVQRRVWTKFSTGVGRPALFLRLFYLAMLFDRMGWRENAGPDDDHPLAPPPATAIPAAAHAI